MTRQSPVVAGDWLTRASLLGSALLVLIGLLVLAGWQQRIDVLVPFRPDNAPMPADMALSLLVLGLAFLALEWKADRLVSLAAIPVAYHNFSKCITIGRSAWETSYGMVISLRSRGSG